MKMFEPGDLLTDSDDFLPRTALRFDVVHSNAIRFFDQLVSSLGGNAEDLLRVVHIDPALFRKRSSVIEYRAIINLLDFAAMELLCPDFGLRLAVLQGGTRVMGPIGLAMKNSQNLGEALGYCRRHIHAYNPAARIEFSHDRPKRTLSIGFEILADRSRSKCQAIEHGLMLTYLSILEITGGAARVRRVALEHSPVAAPGVYEAAFGCEVLFNQPRDGLVIDEKDLLCSIVSPNEEVYEMATRFIADHYPSTTPPMQARVRMVIGRYLGEDCTHERVAAELCMHARTLQRRLRCEGTSFEAIKDEVRREIALRCLQQPDIPLSQVAERLGYAQQSVLSRSCYRWFALSPTAVRERVLAETLLD
jgi:AraC-like DNA-binding protein